MVFREVSLETRSSVILPGNDVKRARKSRGGGNKVFQDLAFMVDSPPVIMPLSVDLDKHLVEVPT